MKITILFLAAFILCVSCSPLKKRRGCNIACPMYIIQFCGSDGKTYNSNECFIKSQWCSQGKNDFESFSSLHYGACTGDEEIQSTTSASL